MTVIRAGTEQELLQPQGAEWVFVDVGFSANSKSCGHLQIAGNSPWPNILSAQTCKFGQLKELLTKLVAGNNHTLPLNLVIEAPLSVAFGAKGNPCGRTCEKRDQQTRYWYVGLGCSVLVATQFLLDALRRASGNREVRLFEGLVSFKDGGPSDHLKDVRDLAEVVRSGGKAGGRFIKPEPVDPKGTLRSIGAILGVQFDPPWIVEVGP